MDKVFFLILDDGLGRKTEIGAFTSMEKAYKYQAENPKGLYEYWEVKEICIIE
jgi:hypothetical protein